jgi:hypothetical protein
MNALLVLLFIALCIGGGALLLPALALVVAGAVFFIWLLPILLIANSDQTSGGEKLCWILAIVFLSWFAWILYFLVAPIKPRRERLYYYRGYP